MKVLLSSLQEYIDLNMSPKEIGDLLTMAGLEVDGIVDAASGFDGIIVAKVIEVHPHPNADKLRIAQVFDGKQTLQVVCAASNCRAGLKTAFAPIGASLHDEEGKPWKIKKGKLRDVESFGMLCAADELGLEESSEGIMELPDDSLEGTDLKSLFNETVFEISITPNLGHCLSVLGIARELSALLNIPLKRKSYLPKENHSDPIDKAIDVLIEDKDQCHRFACALVRGVKVGPSPEWLKKKLELCGIRSINNVVDIGNFVMLELGQPMHMFDYECIAGHKLIVRASVNESTLETLDDVARNVPKGVILVCDADKPLSFAGVMGGKSSSVTEMTRNVLIEAAYFTPQAIRKSCKLLGLRSESSYRFERGIDADGTPHALYYAAKLLSEISGGSVAAGLCDRKSHMPAHKEITCRLKTVQTILGLEISLHEVIEIFKRLQIAIVHEGEDFVRVKPPSYRHDLNIEYDLVEEVGRIYGYNNLPRKPARYSSSTVGDTPMFTFENQVRDCLMSEGLQEWITCDLISPELAELTIERTLDSDAIIRVRHPSSIDQSVLRPNLLASLLPIVKRNQDFQIFDLNVFEIGHNHFHISGKYHERTQAGILLCGKRSPHHWDIKPADVDFYDVKGLVENFCAGLGIQGLSFQASHLHNFHPGRQARVYIGKVPVGLIGEIHPDHLKVLDIKQRVYYAEIDLIDIYPYVRKEFSVRTPAQFPGSERDWTLSLKEWVPVQQVLDAVETVRSPILESITLLDLYKSERIGKDKKNATFRFFYRDRSKTISLEAVEAEHQKLIEKVAEKLRDFII